MHSGLDNSLENGVVKVVIHRYLGFPNVFHYCNLQARFFITRPSKSLSTNRLQKWNLGQKYRQKGRDLRDEKKIKRSKSFWLWRYANFEILLWSTIFGRIGRSKLRKLIIKFGEDYLNRRGIIRTKLKNRRGIIKIGEALSGRSQKKPWQQCVFVSKKKW